MGIGPPVAEGRPKDITHTAAMADVRASKVGPKRLKLQRVAYYPASTIANRCLALRAIGRPPANAGVASVGPHLPLQTFDQEYMISLMEQVV